MILDRMRQKLFPAEPAAERGVSPLYRVPDGMRVYAVGDVHGRSTLLARMMEAIRRDSAEAKASQVMEVYLGDYIDRGLHSREVLDLLLTPPMQGHERVCLMGNHEEALLRFIDSPAVLREWGSFGGYATLASYGIAIPDSMAPEKLAIVRDRLLAAMPTAHLDFIKKLPSTYAAGEYLFVHAGLLPSLPVHEQKPEHLLRIREPFLSYTGFFDHYVVHGHSPLRAPEILPNRANLDISDAAVSSLCCLVLEGASRRTLVVTEAE